MSTLTTLSPILISNRDNISKWGFWCDERFFRTLYFKLLFSPFTEVQTLNIHYIWCQISYILLKKWVILYGWCISIMMSEVQTISDMHIFPKVYAFLKGIYLNGRATRGTGTVISRLHNKHYIESKVEKNVYIFFKILMFCGSGFEGVDRYLRIFLLEINK